MIVSTRHLMLGVALFGALLANTAGAAESVVIEVMNPRGEVPPPPITPPADRVSKLDGKTVGIYWIGKAGGDNFWDGVEELMHQNYPSTKVVRFQGPFDLGDARAAEIVKQVDTMFYGVGD